MPIKRASLEQQRELAISYVPINSLKPYPGNARRHSAAQIKKIAQSLDEFSWTNPLLATHEREIICGHGRWEAAKLRGDSDVPVIIIDDLSDAQRRAYIVADNAIAEKSNWDRDLLRSELQGLIELGYNIELTGFDTLEIDTLLTVGDQEVAPENELIEVPDEKEAPLTRLHDHWVIGQHHLFCADATLPESYEILLGDKRPEIAFLDPPYNTASARISGLGRVKHGNFIQGSGELSEGAFVHEFLRPMLRSLNRFCQPGAIGFICCDWRMDPLLREAAIGTLHEQKNLIIWAKTSAGMGSFYRSQVELIQAWKISAGPTINNFNLGKGGRHRSNLWTYPGANVFRRGRMEDLAEHPTVKPTRLIADALRDCSRRGGVVIDPYLGSGSTLAAAELTGRIGYGLELDPKYCDVILRRLAKATGTTPSLFDGTPFDEVRAARMAERTTDGGREGRG
jgi:DNA modification methylase